VGPSGGLIAQLFRAADYLIRPVPGSKSMAPPMRTKCQAQLRNQWLLIADLAYRDAERHSLDWFSELHLSNQRAQSDFRS